MIDADDPAALNSFLRETLTVSVSKVGRSATREAKALESRCKIVFLQAGRTLAGKVPETFERAPDVLAQAAADSAPNPVFSEVEGQAVAAALDRVKAAG